MPPKQLKVAPTPLQAGDRALVARGPNLATAEPAMVELGDAATRGVGTEAGQVAAGQHTHTQSDVTGLEEALSGLAPLAHTHQQADITGLADRLATQDGAIAAVQAQVEAIDIPEAIIPTGEEIRDALGALSGEDRLDASAVKNIPIGESLKTAAQHAADNTALAAGQRGRESDTQREKVGPGAWNSLPYVGESAAGIEELEELVATKADAVPTFTTVAEMLADPTSSRAAGVRLMVKTASGPSFEYRVAASDATDHHLTTVGGVKLYAVPANGLYMTPEQLGYTAAAQNWGQVAQIAFNAGYVLRLGPREYLTSTTAYIRSRSGVVGEGSRVSGVRAVDGFTGNVIDTTNFDILAATDAVNHSDGVLQQPILRGLYIDGNRAAFGATVTTSNGFGVRLYGRQMILDDVRIVKTAGVGLMMQLSQIGSVTETYHPKDHAKSGVLRDVFIYDSGEENFIFRGPTDIRIDTLYAGWAAGSLGTSYNASKTSLHYPGETVDSVVFDNAGCEIGQIHAFDNKNGWGVKIRSNVVEIDYSSATAMTGVAPGTTLTGGTSGATGVLVSKYANGWTGTLVVRPVTGTFQAGESISGGGGTATTVTVIARSPRFRCTDFMSERNYGQLSIGPQVRYEIEGEVHNNEGGAGARPMIEDNSTVGGLARFKAVRGGTENGSSIIELKGSKGLWSLQAQTPSARAGHGIDLSGTDYIITAMVERASGTNFAGETSSGVIFRPGNARNRVTAKARECARSFWIQSGSSAGNILDLESYAHTGGAGADFFGLTNLGFTERRMGRFVSSAASYPWGEMSINGPELTIASGAITLTHNAHPVDTESNAASDDLATVTAAAWVVVGSRITLRAASSARTVRLVEGGNLRLGGVPIELDDATDRVVLEWDGAQWVVLLGASGGSSGPSTVPPFTTVALMLADTNSARAEGDALQVETSDGLLFEYRVAAPAATNHHLATAGGAKLYAVPVAGLFMTPEQLGYTSAAANWGAVAQIAWNAGYVLRLGPREYLTSTTAYIRSRTGVIGEGDRVSGVKAAPGFGGNIIDTENFAARQAGGSVLNDDETALGALYGVVLRDFYVDGNRANVPAGTATAGIGVRLYGRMPAITNLRIVYCAAHGMQTALASGTADPFSSLDHSRIGFVDGLWVMDCGREGWIFQGPADIPCGRLFIGNNGKAGSGVYDALSRTTSLVFPGETCDGLVLDNVGAEFANGHVWNHQHGRGIRIRTDASGVRARFFNMISEGNWGQVHIESGARVEFYGEIHGNDGGPRNERVFYDATNNAGTAWAVGQTLTGATSGAVGTITAVDVRTSSTGMITVSFASDADREKRFADNETVSNGLGRTAVVYRPDYIGAVPWWRDESMQGNLVSLKVFQTGLNDGGPMLRIQGQNHVYTVQAQSSTPRFGHAIVLVGNNVTLSGFIEGRARYAADGTTPSTGLFVDAAAQRANVDLTIKACQRSVVFGGAGIGSRFNITSIDPLGDHMDGLTAPSAVLDAATIARSRLIAIDAGTVTWERGGSTLATTAESRGGTSYGSRTPAVDALAAAEVDRGSVNGEVTVDPSNGPNQLFTITGATRFVPPSSGLFPCSGVIRLRMNGSYSVTWGDRIRRDVDDAALAPDPRPGVDTLYSYFVTGGVMRVFPLMPEDSIGIAVPTMAQFAGFWDPANGARIGDAASAASAINDPVMTLLPAGGVWTYLDSAGASLTLSSGSRNYVTTESTYLPTLVDLNGRRAIRHLDGGAGLRAQLSGLAQIGNPNPSGDAMPYLNTLTWGTNIYLPAGGGLGPIGGVYRADNSNTAQMALMAGSSTIYGHGRFASGAVRQVSSAADVSANIAVSAAEIAAPRGRWVPATFQVRVNSIDTTADTDPPGTTVRGEGATMEIWLSNGLDGHAVVDISSYRGANGLGYRCNRSVLGALYNATTLQDASDVYTARNFVSMDPALTYGSALWWQTQQWLRGVA